MICSSLSLYSSKSSIISLKNSITIGFLSLLESRPGFTCVAYSYNFNKTWGSAASSLLNAKQDYRPSKHTINEGELSY